MPIPASLAISLRIAFTATAVVAVIGLGLAWALSRPGWRGRSTVDVIVSLPLALPPTVLGYYLLLLLGRSGPVGRLTMKWWGTTLIFTPAAAVMACTVVSLPLFVQAARNALEAISDELRDAAQDLGAGRWQTFRHVYLPLAWPGVATGLVLAFARSLGEFGATLMVAGNIPGKTQTMAVAIYSAVQAGHRDMANLLTIILTGAAGAAMWAGLRWRGNAFGRPRQPPGT